MRAATSRGADRRRTQVLGEGSQPCRTGAGAPGGGPVGRGRGPLWAGRGAWPKMSQDCLDRRRFGDEGDDAHVSATTKGRIRAVRERQPVRAGPPERLHLAQARRRARGDSAGVEWRRRGVAGRSSAGNGSRLEVSSPAQGFRRARGTQAAAIGSPNPRGDGPSLSESHSLREIAAHFAYITLRSVVLFGERDNSEPNRDRLGTAKHLHLSDCKTLTPFSPTSLSEIKSTEDWIWDSSTQLECKRAPPLPRVPTSFHSFCVICVICGQLSIAKLLRHHESSNPSIHNPNPDAAEILTQDVGAVAGRVH